MAFRSSPARKKKRKYVDLTQSEMPVGSQKNISCPRCTYDTIWDLNFCEVCDFDLRNEKKEIVRRKIQNSAHVVVIPREKVTPKRSKKEMKEPPHSKIISSKDLSETVEGQGQVGLPIKLTKPVPDNMKEEQRCPICLEDKHRSVCWRREACGCWGCLEDLYMQYKTCLDSGKLASCVCNKPLSEEELSCFLELYMAYKTTCSAHKDPRKSMDLFKDIQTMTKKQEKVYLAMGLNTISKRVQCPGVDCPVVVVREANFSQVIVCHGCKTEYCSLCRSQPYHHTIDCHQVPDVRAQYTQWVTQDREAYLGVMALISSEYKKKLEEFNKQKLRHDKEKDRITSLIKQFEKDEKWKARHCRHCPKCSRIVEKIDGCDAMICGKNYHGGGKQNGCGAKFNWSSASRYRAGKAKQKRLNFDKIRPEKELDKWVELDGEPMKCELCKDQIMGIRLQCVNCPYFNICATCEPGAMEHQEKPESHRENHCDGSPYHTCPHVTLVDRQSLANKLPRPAPAKQPFSPEKAMDGPGIVQVSRKVFAAIFVVFVVSALWLVLVGDFGGISAHLREGNSDSLMISESLPPRTHQPKTRSTAVFLELGAHNGDWTKKKCDSFSALVQFGGKESAVSFERWSIERYRCVMFDASPLHHERRKKVAKKCGCIYMNAIVSTRDNSMAPFQVSNIRGGVGSSIYKNGTYTPASLLNQTIVAEVNIGRWITENIDPNAHVWVRMDIEGAEYNVMRKLINTGVACKYFDVLEFEGHAMYNPKTHHMRPVDVVLPWLLRECGVDVRFESYYGTKRRDRSVLHAWPKEDKCRPGVCPLLYEPIAEITA
ncbi:hypothetical protein AAMO2058_001507400 [Amorphochlora amoebiformis]